MPRALVTASALVLVLSTPCFSTHPDPIRIELPERAVQPGLQEVVVAVYSEADGGRPIATERRLVHIGEGGGFDLPFRVPNDRVPRWITVRLAHGGESRRVLLPAREPGDIAIHVVTDAAITANGVIESIAQGFRFPDATVQTTAVSLSGATPQTVSGNTGTPGSSPNASRADHAHPHGDLVGGTLHAVATTNAAGFLSSADKTKLNSLPTYARTILVTGGGTASANGTALSNALNGISGNSATSPYLLKIEPGVYDLSGGGLTMKSYVDIEGSGENATFIQSARSSASVGSAAALVTGAANSEIRNLTMTSSAGGNAYAIGYFASGTGTFSLRNVMISAGGGFQTTYGMYIQSSSYVTGSRLNVTANAVANGPATGFHAASGTTFALFASTIKGSSQGSGTIIGVQTNSSTVVGTIDSSTIIATGSSVITQGLLVSTGDVLVTNSVLRAETAQLRRACITGDSSAARLRIMHSQLLAFSSNLNGSHVSAHKGINSTLYVATSMLDSATTATPKCVHIWDKDWNNLNDTCPAVPG